MNKSRKFLTIAECKIQATILLKSLYSDDITKVKAAAKRFQCLPEFANFSLEKFLEIDIKHKHALTVIAHENGFSSWINLKIQLPFIRGGFLNKWFADYAEAKAHHQSEGGFLLPYKNQFFICDADYIRNLGFDPNDPDWKQINYDWVKPQNQQAWQRLYKQWMQIQEKINHK